MKAAVCVLICVLTAGIRTANSYSKLDKLDASVRYLFEAGYNMFDTTAEYIQKSQKTTDILVQNPDLVPNYNYNILPSVVMSINPCEFDLEYCKLQGQQSLTDSPVIKKSRAEVKPRRKFNCGAMVASIYVPVLARLHAQGRMRLLSGSSQTIRREYH